MINKKILIVDDSRFMRIVLKKLFDDIENEYMEVIGEAINGAEALDLLNTLKPDIIILDVTLPDINGVEVAKKIIDANPYTKIILSTTPRQMEQAKQALDYGVKDIIEKPFHPEKVMETVIKVIMED